MDFTLTRVDVFPAGTSVKAYLAGDRVPGGAPSGSAVDTQTAGATGVTFSGLARDTAYVAYAKIGDEHRYVGFSTHRPRAERTGDIDAEGDVTVTGDLSVAGELAHTGDAVGFLGADPVGQAEAIDDPTGGSTQDDEARAAIGSILEVLRGVGLVAEPAE